MNTKEIGFAALIICICLTVFSSCKKEYTCMSTNPRVDSIGFTVKDTKRNAKKRCESTKDSEGYSYTLN